jgi:hypothetical protein
MMGTQTLDVAFVLDDTPLLSRKCDCGSEEFRKIIFPESSFALLVDVVACPVCKANLREFHKRRIEPFLDNGLVLCLACKKIFALV